MPRKKRLCPNCFTGEILRPDQQTCCFQCSMEWRELGPERRKERIRQASQPLNLVSITNLPSPAPNNQELEEDEPAESIEQFDINKILPPTT